MKFLKVKDGEGPIHNISAYKVIGFIELNEGSTRLLLDFPMHELTFTVPWNADDLIEEIYGLDDTDDLIEVIDCTPRPPIDPSELLADTTVQKKELKSPKELKKAFKPYIKKTPKKKKGKKKKRK